MNEIWSGQPFALTVPERIAFDANRNLYKFEARPGDKRAEDVGKAIERVRLDGWPLRFQRDRRYVVSLRYRPMLNTRSRGPLDWNIPFEGPVKLAHEYSDGSKTPRLRAILQKPTLDAVGSLTGLQEVTLGQWPDLLEGTETYFVFTFQLGANGYLRLARDGKLMCPEYVGPLGYAPRDGYMQIGIYRNARDYVSKAEFRDLSVAMR